jgi:hypothetical protein
MKRKCTSAQCCDTRGNALYGALFGIVVATLHHIQHALRGQIPENITVHVLSEFIVAACGTQPWLRSVQPSATGSKAARNFA